MGMIDGTRFLEILSSIVFFILLVAALLMLSGFYICDSHTCKAFTIADEKGPEGTKDNVLALMGELYNDGIWPIPYIGAAILTPLCLWFLSIPITIKTFAILFFTSFVVIYFMFSFFGHHYIRPISSYVSEYIQDSCPNSSVVGKNICDNENPGDNNTQNFASYIQELGITFATPVNIF